MTGSPPLVTIVVVPRERFDYTEESLASLYAQTPEPFELIYVDNALPRGARRALQRVAGTASTAQWTLLDIGTGLGDIPAAAARLSPFAARGLTTIGLELAPSLARA
jgi:hypothetical protein